MDAPYPDAGHGKKILCHFVFLSEERWRNIREPRGERVVVT